MDTESRRYTVHETNLALLAPCTTDQGIVFVNLFLEITKVFRMTQLLV